LFGGLNLGPSGVFNQHNVMGDTWLWNGTSWSQITSFFNTPATPASRFGATMAYDPVNQRTVLFGGVDTNGNVLSDTWLFGSVHFCFNIFSCATLFKWTQLNFVAGSSPPGRHDASMGYAPSTGILLTGGLSSTGVDLADTWVFNGAANTWAPLNVINSPTPP